MYALPPLPDVVRYAADVEIAATIDVTRNVDTRSSCSPGQKYTLVNEGRLLYERKVRVTVVNDAVSITGPVAGDAWAQAKVTSYAETNYCDPQAPVDLREPQCDPSHDGKARAAFFSDEPKRRNHVMLTIARAGGGTESDPCKPPSLDVAGGKDEERVAPFDGTSVAMTLGLDLRGRSFATLGRGKRLHRMMRLSGTCDAVRITHGRKPPLSGATPCFVDGTVDVRIRRR